MITELDIEIFICCQCGNEFNHTQGSWLPVGVEKNKFFKKVSNKTNEPPIVFIWDFSKPEIVTSNKFTCYNCQP